MSSFFDIEYGYTPNPGYLDLIAGVLKNVRWHYGKDKWQNYSVPFDFFNDMKDNFDFPFDDFCPIVYASVIFTIVRYGFENFVCKVSIQELCRKMCLNFFNLFFLFELNFGLNHQEVSVIFKFRSKVR